MSDSNGKDQLTMDQQIVAYLEGHSGKMMRYEFPSVKAANDFYGSEVLNPELPPHNMAAELAVLGGMIIDNDNVFAAAKILSKKDFFLQRHAVLFDIMVDLVMIQQKAADYVTVSDALERGKLFEIVPLEFLMDLLDKTPYAHNVPHYATIVERLAQLRRLIRFGERVVQLAWQNDDTDPLQLVEQAESYLFDLNIKDDRRDPKPIGVLLDKFQDRMHDRAAGLIKNTSIKTGLPGLDKTIGGWKKSKLYILAGRPGMGKSALALWCMLRACIDQKKKGMIFTLEMDEDEVTTRFVSSLTGISGQKIEDHPETLTPDQWGDIARAEMMLDQACIFVDDTSAISLFELRSKAIRYQLEYGLDFILIDYLQLMRGDAKSQNREQEIAYITRGLKALARDLSIPILALSQLSRNVESRGDKRPMLSDLRESGSIEQDGDWVGFIYRDDYYDPDTEFPNIAEIISAKNRGGPSNQTTSAYYKRATGSFSPLETRVVQLGY